MPMRASSVACGWLVGRATLPCRRRVAPPRVVLEQTRKLPPHSEYLIQSHGAAVGLRKVGLRGRVHVRVLWVRILWGEFAGGFQ